jgi:hypothetical protein
MDYQDLDSLLVVALLFLGPQLRLFVARRKGAVKDDLEKLV